ncbi:MAG: glycosyltransferase family 4 protein [Polyangiaceae bacterium]|nr:glycosyltransferase family 4 protein [Polyangiaceae bacterium]
MTTVAIDARFWRAEPSGIGAVVAAQVTRLPSRASDLEFVLITHPSRPTPVCAPNVRCLVAPYVPDGPGTMLALGGWLRARATWDVFHGASSALPHDVGPRTVVTLHAVMWLDDPALVRRAGPWGLAETLFYRHAMGRAARRASALVVPSEATRERATRWTGDGARRITVTPWGLPDAFRRPAPTARALSLSRHGVTTPRYALVVGKSAGYKNHDGAVRAFARAFRGDPSTSLGLVQRAGDGADRLRALAASLGVGDQVHAVPAESDEELAALYAGAHALLHPSVCEGFGFPLLEAMAMGCPVVASDAASLPEVGGDAALYAAPDDATTLARHLRALLDPDVRRLHVERGRRRVERASWDACVDATAEVYRRLAR